MLMKEEGAPKNTRMFLKTTGIFANNKEMFFMSCMLLKEYMRVKKCENGSKKPKDGPKMCTLCMKMLAYVENRIKV